MVMVFRGFIFVLLSFASLTVYAEEVFKTINTGPDLGCHELVSFIEGGRGVNGGQLRPWWQTFYYLDPVTSVVRTLKLSPRAQFWLWKDREIDVNGQRIRIQDLWLKAESTQGEALDHENIEQAYEFLTAYEEIANLVREPAPTIADAFRRLEAIPLSKLQGLEAVLGKERTSNLKIVIHEFIQDLFERISDPNITLEKRIEYRQRLESILVGYAPNALSDFSYLFHLETYGYHSSENFVSSWFNSGTDLGHTPDVDLLDSTQDFRDQTDRLLPVLASYLGLYSGRVRELQAKESRTSEEEEELYLALIVVNNVGELYSRFERRQSELLRLFSKESMDRLKALSDRDPVAYEIAKKEIIRDLEEIYKIRSNYYTSRYNFVAQPPEDLLSGEPSMAQQLAYFDQLSTLEKIFDMTLDRAAEYLGDEDFRSTNFHLYSWPRP